MYIKHFQLVQRPFSRVPTATHSILYPGLKACLDRAIDGINECAGPVLAVGPSGCGKSTLLALLARQFEGSLSVATLNCAAIDSRHELIQCLLFEMGLPFKSDNVGELRLKLIDHLKSPEQCPNGLLLLVDEGHNLPTDVLEELRMITNMVCGSQHQIRLVIAGAMPLEEKLAHPQLDSFAQRIGVRCYLQPMTRTETMFYALAHIQKAGRDGREIFQPSSLEKIYDITDGVPRLVTQLCDNSLKTAAKADRMVVDAKLVQQAWQDLQQLPSMDDDSGFVPFDGESDGSVIEFGSLDDGPQNQSFSSDISIGSLSDEPRVDSSEFAPPEESSFEPSSQPVNQQSDNEQQVEEATPHVKPVIEVAAQASSDTGKKVDDTLETLLNQLNEIGTPQSALPDLPPLVQGNGEPLPKELFDRANDRVGQNPGIADVTAPAEYSSGGEPSETFIGELTHAQADTGANSGQDSIESLTQALSQAQELANSEHQAKRQELRSESESQQGTPAGMSNPTVQLPLPDDTTMTQPIPPRSSWEQSDPEIVQASTPSEGVHDVTRTISTEELFGGSFDEEHPVDVHSSGLADQNRQSAEMTPQEVASLKPETKPETVNSPQASSPAIVFEQTNVTQPISAETFVARPAGSVQNETFVGTPAPSAQNTSAESNQNAPQPAPAPQPANVTQQWSPELLEQARAEQQKNMEDNLQGQQQVQDQVLQQHQSHTVRLEDLGHFPGSEMRADLGADAGQPANVTPTSQPSPTQSINQTDDSDMLIVEPYPAVQRVPEPEEQKEDPPSTGKVIRMNYQDLFQQLRNQNTNTGS